MIVKLTDAVARAVVPPAKGYALHWCPRTPGFALRVTAAGARAWIAERRVDGKTVRRTLGRANGPGAISADAARRLQIAISSELQQGVDRLEVKRARRKEEARDALTFGEALREYVKGKRRSKDGLALKERTKADYLAMIKPAGTTKSGRPTQAGELTPLVDASLHRLTADEIRKLHTSLASRGVRRQAYAMQVLRAVLRHFGVQVADDPLSPTTAGAGRVRVPASRGRPNPIPAERLGAWWQAACGMETVGADQLRFQLLTGCRPGEAASIVMRDVDLAAGRIKLLDTKNRLDHEILLSKQAALIVARHAKGKRAHHLLFGVADAGKSLTVINVAAGVTGVTAHKLRHTFASVAAELVSAFALKRMLNHISTADVTATSYVHVGDAQLRAAWQAVADAIESSAGANENSADAK